VAVALEEPKHLSFSQGLPGQVAVVEVVVLEVFLLLPLVVLRHNPVKILEYRVFHSMEIPEVVLRVLET
jgi:hypothetical protein